jgi:hypothetical protein
LAARLSGPLPGAYGAAGGVVPFRALSVTAVAWPASPSAKHPLVGLPSRSECYRHEPYRDIGSSIPVLPWAVAWHIGYFSSHPAESILVGSVALSSSCAPLQGLSQQAATAVPKDRRLALLGSIPLQRNPDAWVHVARVYLARCVPAPGLSLGTPSCRLAPLASSRRCSRHRAHGVLPSGLFPSHGAAARFRALLPSRRLAAMRFPPWFGFTEGVTATIEPRVDVRSDYPALRDLLPV